MDWATDFIGWWTTARADTATGVTLAVTAIVAAWIALRQLRQQTSDSRARSRPVVIADLVDIPHAASMALVIKNAGASLARNVTVSFEPPLPESETTADGQRSVIPFIHRRYASPIAVLPAGRELSNVYFSSPMGNANIFGVPEQVTVTVAYTDDQGRPYRDRYPLDVNVVAMGTWPEPSGAPDGQRKTAVKHLGAIADSLKLIGREIPDAGLVAGGRAPEEENRTAIEEARRRHNELLGTLRHTSDPMSS